MRICESLQRGVGVHQRLLEVLPPPAWRLDLTEIEGLDYLAYPDGCILEAQELAARRFGAGRSWFLVNGSTGGIQAAVMATCRPGTSLVLPRNCHLSVFNAMVHSGAWPEWVEPDYDSDWEVATGVTAEAVEAALMRARAANRPAGAVILVRPTYFGTAVDITGIAACCRRWGVPLLTDEAHGAHLGLAPGLCPSALQQGKR